MENIIKCSHPKMTGQNDRQDESLTGQVHDQAGHCPLTGRYFEPCNLFLRLFSGMPVRITGSHARVWNVLKDPLEIPHYS